MIFILYRKICVCVLLTCMIIALHSLYSCLALGMERKGRNNMTRCPPKTEDFQNKRQVVSSGDFGKKDTFPEIHHVWWILWSQLRRWWFCLTLPVVGRQKAGTRPETMRQTASMVMYYNGIMNSLLPPGSQAWKQTYLISWRFGGL